MPPPDISISSSSPATFTPYEPPPVESDLGDGEDLARRELPPGGVPMADAEGQPLPASDAKERETERQLRIARHFAAAPLQFAERVPGGVAEGAHGMVTELGNVLDDLSERDRVAAHNLSHYLHPVIGVGPQPALEPEPVPKSQTLQPLDAPQPSVFGEGQASKLEVLASRVPVVNMFVPAMQALHAIDRGDAGELGRITGRDVVFPMLLVVGGRVSTGAGGSAVKAVNAVSDRVKALATETGEQVAAGARGLAPATAGAEGVAGLTPWQLNESRAAGGGGGKGAGGRGPQWPSREPVASNENPAAHIKNKVPKTGWSSPEALGLVGLLARESGAYTDHVVQFLIDNEYDLSTEQGHRAAIELTERPQVREVLVETLKEEVAGLDVKRVQEGALLERYFPIDRGAPTASAVRRSRFDPMHLAIKVAADLPEIRNTSLRDITRSDPVLARVREDVAVRARSAMENPERFKSDPVLARMSPTLVERVAWRDKAMDPQRFLPVEADMPGRRGAFHVFPEQRVAANESGTALLGQQAEVFKDVHHVFERLPEIREQALVYERAGMPALAEVARQVHEEMLAWASAMADFVVR